MQFGSSTFLVDVLLAWWFFFVGRVVSFWIRLVFFLLSSMRAFLPLIDTYLADGLIYHGLMSVFWTLIFECLPICYFLSFNESTCILVSGISSVFWNSILMFIQSPFSWALLTTIVYSGNILSHLLPVAYFSSCFLHWLINRFFFHYFGIFYLFVGVYFLILCR